MQKSEAGVYGGASGWADAITIVGDLSGGTGGLATVAYTSEPLTYIHSLLPLYGPEIIDSALSHVPDMRQRLMNMAIDGTLPARWNDNSLMQELSLAEQSAYLGNHHMYGSARLGIASYQPGQHEYRWDYLHGITDTFGMSRPRPWYSWALNAPVRAGATSPYAGGLDSTAGGSHVIGMKQYELTNHLGNVQETVSDNKFDKDVNSDGLRDEYRAASVSVYDYYPFGMLMPGRVMLDTAGRCITLTRDYTVPINHWRNGGDLYVSGGVTTGATAFGNTVVNQSSSGYAAGATSHGRSGGMLFTISNITSYSITLKLHFTALAGMTQVRVYSGTDTNGVQLGSANVNYTSPVFSMSLSGITSPTNKNASITIAISTVGTTGYEHDVDLFSLDSLGYNYTTYGLEYGLFTQCNSLSDKYEFGYNGQMKMNEIAGIGNHNTALFWEYSPQIGRRWNLDPKPTLGISQYSTMEDNPIQNSDENGDQPGAAKIITGAARLNIFWDILDLILSPLETANPEGSAWLIQMQKDERAARFAQEKKADENKAKSKSAGVSDTQVGPSGKPKIHKVNLSSRKRAKDAARNNKKSNTAPEEHKNDKGQRNHFHSTKDGVKLKGKDNIHYYYPSKKTPL